MNEVQEFSYRLRLHPPVVARAQAVGVHMPEMGKGDPLVLDAQLGSYLLRQHALLALRDAMGLESLVQHAQL